MKACAITGFGIISSLGLTVDEFWHGLLAGNSAIEPVFIPGESQTPIWQSPVGRAFNPRHYVDDPKVLRNSSRFTFYALAATAQAIRHAALSIIPPERTALVLGTSMGGVPDLVDAQEAYVTQGIHKVPARLMASVIPNMAASQIAIRYNLHGPQLTITNACASSIDSIGVGAQFIASGLADVAICGGMENLLTPVVSASLFHAHALAQADDAHDASKPFDQHRTGFVMGEGSGVVVLESYEHANQRGVPIWGFIKSYASLADGYHVTAPEPSGRWEARVMQQAIERAKFTPADIDLVIAHGTGTPVGDRAEIRAVNQIYRSGHAVITSIKGHMGHSMGASGAMSVISALQAMHTQLVPCTLGTRDVDAEVDFDVVLEEPRPMPVAIAQINAFGFGGQNASLIVTKL